MILQKVRNKQAERDAIHKLLEKLNNTLRSIRRHQYLKRAAVRRISTENLNSKHGVQHQAHKIPFALVIEILTVYIEQRIASLKKIVKLLKNLFLEVLIMDLSQ